jgi:IS5 family transposase
MKITTRCGSSAVEGLNEALLARALSAKVLKTNRVRADTTVVPADIAYPTDSGLLAKGVVKMAKAVKRLKAGGFAPRVRTRDLTQLVRRHARSIGANLRRRTGEAKDEVMAINARMARAASEAVGEARRVAVNARRRLRQLGTAAPPRLESLAHDLEVTAARVARIVRQTRQRLAGSVPEGATRLVSLHDPDARPIRKGRLNRPVEFGYKAQVVDNENGIVLDHAVFIGNPPDAPMLVPAIQRISQLVDDVPKAVAASTPPVPLPLHADLRVMDESRGEVVQRTHHQEAPALGSPQRQRRSPPTSSPGPEPGTRTRAHSCGPRRPNRSSNDWPDTAPPSTPPHDPIFRALQPSRKLAPVAHRSLRWPRKRGRAHSSPTSRS